MSQKLHVKTGDTVVVISGKDKGKQGKVKAAMPKEGRVVVEGVNMIKRHTKPSQANPKGGIIEKEAPLYAFMDALEPKLRKQRNRPASRKFSRKTELTSEQLSRAALLLTKPKREGG